MIFAVFGISSEMWTPGIDVAIVRNGPPNVVFGFGSQLSNWLIPPSIQTKTICLSFAAASAATTGDDRGATPNEPSASPPAAAPAVPSQRRRFSRCSHGLQRFERLMDQPCGK